MADEKDKKVLEGGEIAGYARSLIEASLDPLVTISPEGKITDVNQATINATGIPREKLIGTEFSDYFTDPKQAKEGYKIALKEGFVKNYILVLKHKSGKLMDVSYNASTYKDDEGKILGVFASARDITKEVLEGAEELLSEWAYALNDLSFSSRDGANTEMGLASDAANHWFQTTVGQLPKTDTAYEAAVKYRDLADERKVIKANKFKLEEKEGTVLGTFLSDDCPYKKCCIERKKKGKSYLCFRAVPFIIAIKLMTDKEYIRDILYEQTFPGKVCIVRGNPSQRAFKVGLSYKLGKGYAKINELDCEKMGIDIIDKITVSPTRKEVAGRKINLMSSSQTKYPAGMIIMNIADAKGLGLEEKDTVFINKAGEKEDVELVETSEYESKPGEYEKDYGSPELEAEEQPEDEEEKVKPESGEIDETKEDDKEKGTEEEAKEGPNQKVEREKKKKPKTQKTNAKDAAEKEKQQTEEAAEKTEEEAKVVEEQPEDEEEKVKPESEEIAETKVETKDEGEVKEEPENEIEKVKPESEEQDEETGKKSKQEVEQEKKKKPKTQKTNAKDTAKKEKQKKDFESKIDLIRDKQK